MRGGACRSVPARTARVITTGPGCRSASPGHPDAGTGCWRDAPSQTRARSPTTSATGHAAAAWSIWPGSPGRAGGSRSASSRPRTRQGWTTTRSGPGEPGMPTSPCPCSPLPGWPARKPLPQKGNRRPRPRHDQLHATGTPPTARAPHAATRPPTRARLVLVPLAKTTPAPSPRQPLPRTRLPTLSAVAVACRPCPARTPLPRAWPRRSTDRRRAPSWRSECHRTHAGFLDAARGVGEQSVAGVVGRRVVVAEPVVAIRRDRQGRDAAQPTSEKPNQVERRLVGPVDVLDHHDGQPPGHVDLPEQRAEEGLARRAAAVAHGKQLAAQPRRDVEQRTERARGEHAVAHSPCPYGVGQILLEALQQGGLADTGFAGYEHQAASTATRVLGVLRQRGQEGFAFEQGHASYLAPRDAGSP